MGPGTGIGKGTGKDTGVWCIGTCTDNYRSHVLESYNAEMSIHVTQLLVIGSALLTCSNPRALIVAS